MSKSKKANTREERPASSLSVNPENPRTITDSKLVQLERSMEKHGDISGVIFNVRDGLLYGGNQRSTRFDENSKVVITKRYDKPTRTGTVAVGYVLHKGERFNYREVDWDKDTATAAMIAANKNAGVFDEEKLTEHLKRLGNFDIDFDLDLTMFDSGEIEELLGGNDEDEELYTNKIVSPIYEPKGPKPKVDSLFNSSKTESLLKEIEKAPKVPKEVKEFLTVAAYRHTVFDYREIAEYYSHAPAEVQNLMERSALVIIDFKKAIENGFVVLSEKLGKAYLDA